MDEFKSRRPIPLDQILNITEEMNPDDFEVAELEDLYTPHNLQKMIEQKDDFNPDDFDDFNFKDWDGTKNEI